MIVLWPRQCRAALRRAFGALGALGLLGGLGSLPACAPTADDSKLPPEVQDPKALHTPAGALELYRAALLQLPTTFDQTMLTGAVFTDELAATRMPFGVAGPYTGLDSRLDPGGSASDEVYKRLHRLRAQLREARGFLGTYASDTATARALQGHLFAVEGYADVLLADLFCSGIPLSTVDFQGDYTLTSGLSTREVYRRAVGLFDSALALLQAPVPASGLAPDSAALFQQLATVGKGRALLALGVYDSAALTTTAVPTEFRYQVPVPPIWSMWYFANDNGANDHTSYATAPGVPGVGRLEGQNGLDYLVSDDPRVGGTPLGDALYGGTYYFPAKYDPASTVVTLTLAGGIEARLIEAEAALQAGNVDTWLTALNALRTSGGETVADTVADTLGVTGCDAAHICGSDPGGSTPEYGQPAGGFVVPAGYSLVTSYTIYPVSAAIHDYCWNYSWYQPCYWHDSTTVYVYAGSRTKWAAGSGGVAELPALADPGTAAARVDLMFRERAFWLYLTAHRQGDLRRLIRQYQRSAEVVYPTGAYPGATNAYGAAVVIPVPEMERKLNPQYSGCINTGA